ncbi:ABC transporter ATP-binding protein [Oscillospiraceae bacterium HV4-5-C5C]|nr:ABC transporter ATP-binding protein [Oscillospiraceae bacterium HV4-5-C5C]
MTVSQLSCTHLSAGYPGQAVLEDLTLNIPAGQITALIGANGSGKSTLLKTLAALQPTQGGSIYLNGRDISRLAPRALARQLALLPQDSNNPEGLSVRELVSLGRFPYRRHFSGLSADDQSVITLSLQQTGLLDLAQTDLGRLSGGQRQRAWIAMALAQQTGLLFLDEPTTYLDIAHQLEVLQLLRQINRDSRVTIVMVLHDLNQAVQFSDQLIALKSGHVYDSGPSYKLLTPELVRAVFGIKAVVLPHPVTGVPVCLPYAPQETVQT